ncbi:MAG: DUF2786 domain-containing protein [Desulfobacteraceae bacterium]|nr:DUF2786 domain-containing protein [Desulfobacteraceae bacterium]
MDTQCDLRQKIEHRILKGLDCEWKAAADSIEPPYQGRLKMPMFRLENMERQLGAWSSHTREIRLSRQFVMTYPWDAVREVLHHEMAHQFSHEVLNASPSLEPPHGSSFRTACQILRANPKASGHYRPLQDRISSRNQNEPDRIMRRIRKLMSLAQSSNPNEAEAAMVKAHQLITRHNVDLIRSQQELSYASIFIGRPALRHFRETYQLANLLIAHFFIKGIWVPAYVMEKEKLGRVLEISGTPENVEIAAYVHDCVVRYIESQWTAYRQRQGHKLNRYRKTDFAVGIIDGFREKLEMKTNDHRLMATATHALIKVEDARLNAYIKERYPYVTSFRRDGGRQDDRVLKDGMDVGRQLIISKGITERKTTAKPLLVEPPT